MLHEELAQLQQWLAGLKYADVRRVEHVLPAKRADGRVLRGIRIIRRLYLARDRVFYRVAWDESVAKPVSLVEVLSIVRASFVALRFRAYSMRQKRLRTTRSISRP